MDRSGEAGAGGAPAAPAAERTDGSGEVGAGLPAGRLQGTEPLYGAVVGLELVTVAILNLTMQSGAGAPKHPATGQMWLGLGASVVFLGSLFARNRTVAAFGALIAAFFVTLPRVPTSLAVPHILALAFPVVYALLITQRQRKALRAAIKGAPRPAPGRRARTRRPSAPAPRKPAPASPPARASGRYTPPKSQRATRSRSRGR